MKFPPPGSWLKHYPCEGGRLPFYLQFCAELPYATASGAVCTMKLENGTVIQANPQFLRWLQPLVAGDRKPRLKEFKEPAPKPKARVDGRIKRSLAAAAEPKFFIPSNDDVVMYPRLTGRSA